MTFANQGLPRIVQGLDVRSLPLSPEEAFVLSRIDGCTPSSDIASATGLTEERVIECLRHLRELGAISYQSSSAIPAVTPSPSSDRPHRPSSSARLRPAIELPVSSEIPHPAARLYDEKELDEPADLDVDRKKLILHHYSLLDRLTHYEVLQVSEQATREEIREAYYELVGLFHPDRYFGKDLGSFKGKLEAVFKALTKAYDTLTRQRSRDEYDRYLTARRRTAGLRESIPPVRLTPRPSPPVVDTHPPAQPTPRPSPPVVDTHPPAQPTPRPSPPVVDTHPPAQPSSSLSQSPDAPGNTSSGHSPLPPFDIARTPRSPSGNPDSMRKALARKLGPRRTSIPPPPRTPDLDPDTLAQTVSRDLKIRYEKRRQEAALSPADRYRTIALKALEDGQLPSAINALKVALTVVPEDEELIQLLAQAQEAADVAHADQFLAQAQYEEKDGRYVKAAQSYERAARGKRSAALYNQAARCLLQAATEPRKAVELARKAVELDSHRAQYRLTLARAYHLGNLPTSASAELERAMALAPGNEEIKTWSKRLK